MTRSSPSFLRAVACATVLFATLLAIDARAAGTAEAAAPPAPAPAKVERGRYLVTIAGCNDCHTPLKLGANGPEPDMSRMLSGHPQQIVITAPAATPQEPWLVTTTATNTAWSGPWGVSFPANLTPDPETGLGRWTLRNFVDTIRSGRHLGRGRAILPPMPIPMYKHMTDDDLEAVYSYLRTIPPIQNRVPEPLPPAAAPRAGS